ncbi:hypothetical protein HZA38_00125 [Candidatus Peregrinibacteria bacterium]|nr:hypothetical protein [Candidatus Peregrinibacteria bacterium]
MSQIPSLTTLLLRIFSGIAGGLIGVISALLIVFTASFVETGGEDIPSSLTISFSNVVVLSMVFVGTLVSNLSVGLFLGFFEKTKYKSLRRISLQIFIFTLVLFLLFLPAYLIAVESQLSVASVHFFVSALVASLLCEIMSGSRNSLTGLLGVLISGALIFGIFFLIVQMSLKNSILLIFALPIAWIFIILGVYFAEVLRGFLFKIYGWDPFLQVSFPDELEK